MMGEPALTFGILLAAASFFFWNKQEILSDLGERNGKSGPRLAYIEGVFRPVSVWVFATGLMMASLTAAILYYQLGHAPPQEPLSGYFANSWVEPAFLGLVWGLTALGALLSPVALVKWNRPAISVVRFCWSAGGFLLVCFSAMDYFTHIGLLMNTSDSF